MYAYSPLFPTGSVTEQLNAKRWAFTLYMSVIIRWEGLILDNPLCTLVQLDQAFPHFLGEGDFTVAKNRFRACQYFMPATVWFPCKAYLLEDELSPYSGMDGLILKNNFAQ